MSRSYVAIIYPHAVAHIRQRAVSPFAHAGVYATVSAQCQAAWALGANEKRMPTVILYAKAGCHLCDEARDYLEDLAAAYTFALDEIDIRRDETLFARYRYRIPVIAVDGVERLEGRITPEEVAALGREFPPR
jgi:glutaredoxin